MQLVRLSLAGVIPARLPSGPWGAVELVNVVRACRLCPVDIAATRLGCR